MARKPAVPFPKILATTWGVFAELQGQVAPHLEATCPQWNDARALVVRLRETLPDTRFWVAPNYRVDYHVLLEDGKVMVVVLDDDVEQWRQSLRSLAGADRLTIRTGEIDPGIPNAVWAVLPKHERIRKNPRESTPYWFFTQIERFRECRGCGERLAGYPRYSFACDDCSPIFLQRAIHDNPITEPY